MNNKNSTNKARSIRQALGLPDSNGEIIGLVSESPAELCENTIEAHGCVRKKKDRLESCGQRSEAGISSTMCENGTPFDYGPSGGAASPNTEVNADHQGIISEVPRDSKRR